MILDAHQHLIYPDQWPYSWTAGVTALAGRAFRHQDYLAAIASTGITRGIFMETTPDAPHWEKEAGFVADLAATTAPSIVGIIANCQPQLPGFERYVESIRSPRLVGLRRILHVEPDDLSRSPLFVKNVKSLGKQNLAFDLCVLARQIPLAIDLIRQCPDTQFILDHCGNPDIAADAGAGPAKSWRDLIRQIAAFPNIACKISGIVANCSPGTVNADLLRPYVEHCIEIFGWHRVIWASDWPVCLTRCDLKTWVDCTQQIIAKAPAADRQKMLFDNAMRIYGVKAAS